MAENLKINISAIDNATRVLKGVGQSIGTLQKSIRLLTGATGLGFVIQIFGMLQKAISQNTALSEKFKSVTEGFTSILGELLAPILELIIDLWKRFGDEVMLAVKIIAQAINMLLIPIKRAYDSIKALVEMTIKVMKGDFKGAWEIGKKSANDTANEYVKAADKMGQAWNDYSIGKILDTKKTTKETKKAADEEEEIKYNSYTEMIQMRELEASKIADFDERRKEKTEKILAENKRMTEEANAEALADREAAAAAEEKLFKKHSDAIRLMTNLASSFRVGFGNAFQGAITGGIAFSVSMIQLFRNMRDMVIRFIGEMIAKMVTLFLLKKLLGFATGSGLTGLAGILKGTIKGITGAQTSPGQLKIIPGSRYEPVPILAHGGEAIGRPGAGGMGGMIINVQGSIYNGQETAEAIRNGLYNLRRGSGRTV